MLFHLASIVTGTEPWILLGAMAAVAHRVRLGVMVGSSTQWPEAVDVLGRLSGGRVVVGMRPNGESQSSSPLPASILMMCSTPREAAGLSELGHGVILAGGDREVRLLRAGGDFEIWVDAPIPTDRAGWANMIASLEAAGATGVIVPWDPRIIDLLRNAGEADDRTDLLIATG